MPATSSMISTSNFARIMHDGSKRSRNEFLGLESDAIGHDRPAYFMKSRVFVSCGQNRDSGELEFARRIGQLLESLGFDPYVALSEQTLRGLKENIFARLS